MATTPQTNATLDQIAQALREHDDYLIVGHVSPDGDCVGSQLALMHALRRAGKRATCAFAGDASSLDASLEFLPGVQDMLPSSAAGSSMCVIAVDVPTRKRMGEAVARLHEAADFTVTLDHHASDEAPSQMMFVDPQAASTTLIVWNLIGALGVDRSGEVATCALTGLVTDTGRFQYQNTDARAFQAAAEMLGCGADLAHICTQVFQKRRLASLKVESRAVDRMELLLDGALAISYVSLADLEEFHADKSDADTVVNVLRSLDGVRVACAVRENADEIRVNLRSKDATDVAAFAREYDGGGHAAAAGMTTHGPLSEAYGRIKEQLCAYLRQTWES